MAEALTPGAKRAGPGEYVFDLHKVNQIIGGPDYSPVFGGCVEGERMIVALMRYPAGQPSEPHSHPNEQWIFILEGELEMQFDGRWHKAGPGEVFYVPANVQGRLARPARHQGRQSNCLRQPGDRRAVRNGPC